MSQLSHLSQVSLLRWQSWQSCQPSGRYWANAHSGPWHSWQPSPHLAAFPMAPLLKLPGPAPNREDGQPCSFRMAPWLSWLSWLRCWANAQSVFGYLARPGYLAWRLGILAPSRRYWPPAPLALGALLWHRARLGFLAPPARFTPPLASHALAARVPLAHLRPPSPADAAPHRQSHPGVPGARLDTANTVNNVISVTSVTNVLAFLVLLVLLTPVLGKRAPRPWPSCSLLAFLLGLLALRLGSLQPRRPAPGWRS